MSSEVKQHLVYATEKALKGGKEAKEEYAETTG